MKVRKKPVVVDAWEWDMTQKTFDTLWDVPGFQRAWLSIEKTAGGIIKALRIRTLESDLYIQDGDYIIRGIKGEFYACKPDIFEMTYDVLGETSPEKKDE